MGVVLWAGCGIAAFIVARLLPAGRAPARVAEALLAVLSALALGVAATALDFGGWAEPDWRAGVFSMVGSLAAVGSLRAFRSARTPSR